LTCIQVEFELGGGELAGGGATCEGLTPAGLFVSGLMTEVLLGIGELLVVWLGEVVDGGAVTDWLPPPEEFDPDDDEPSPEATMTAATTTAAVATPAQAAMIQREDPGRCWGSVLAQAAGAYCGPG
jgi:hypothetical protein